MALDKTKKYYQLCLILRLIRKILIFERKTKHGANYNKTRLRQDVMRFLSRTFFLVRFLLILFIMPIQSFGEKNENCKK